MANNKDKKFFGRMLNFIGLEETTEDESDYRFEDEGDDFNDNYDDAYLERDADRDGGYGDPEPVAFSRGGKGSRRGISKPSKELKRTREAMEEMSADNRGSNVVGFKSGGGGGGSKMKMIVYQPITYDDTQNIIDNLKNRKPIIVNLESLEMDIAQRILDFISGAVYSLDGNIHKISKGIFILAPSNVDISGNVPDELQGKSFYTLGNKPRREY